MISQAIIVNNEQVLMVRQYVQRGDIVWNFPGGGMEEAETPEEACVREVKEETGYDVRIVKLIHQHKSKYTFEAEVIGGVLQLDKSNKDNEDIVEVAWISLLDTDKFDTFTRPIIDLVATR